MSVVPQPPLVEPLRRWDPEQVGGYVLIGRLGAGAMGRVYLGRSAAGRLVAVKMIKAELAEEPDFRNRFGQEVAAARRVSGAFTAAVVAADSEADIPWLATVYVPAPSLSRLIRTCGPIGVPAVRWLAAGCAEALESIHGVGLVHRDLKPSNVLVSLDGPRVIDFGVARAAERIQLTVTRGSVGTPAYMAPEQARDTRLATGASDIFALGATMLFAATGHAPYQGETVMDVLVQLATGPPDLAGLPPELAEVVGACLERDPRNRPTSASVLARLAAELDADDRGAPPLPGEALALIEEYHRIPRSSAEWGAASSGVSMAPATDGRAEPGADVDPDGNEVAGDDDTVRSQPFGSADRWFQPGAAIAGSAVQGAGDRRQTRRDRLPAGRRVLLGVVATAAAAALVAAGWAGATAAGAERHSSGGGKPAATHGLPLEPAAGHLPGGGHLPNGLGPVIGQSRPSPGVPVIAVNQPAGDPHTGFVIHGQSWPPGEPVTIDLVGVRVSPIHPVADERGMFNYVINQDHEFFPGGLPDRIYTVRVTAADGATATAKFEVLRSLEETAASSAVLITRALTALASTTGLPVASTRPGR
jgi:Protein kinase domain